MQKCLRWLVELANLADLEHRENGETEQDGRNGKIQRECFTKQKRDTPYGVSLLNYVSSNYLLNANATFTAQATVQPTIGLLPIPRKPIISTCAGTEEEPAN